MTLTYANAGLMKACAAAVVVSAPYPVRGISFRTVPLAGYQKKARRAQKMQQRRKLRGVMNLGENRIGMRIRRLAWSPAVPRFPHSQAIPDRVHNSL